VKPTSRHLAALIEGALEIVAGLRTVPAVWARNTAPGQRQLLRYSAVDVSKRPPTIKAGAKRTHHHRQHEDVAAFGRAKARANSGASRKFGPALGPRTSPGISIGPGVGFMGMSQSVRFCEPGRNSSSSEISTSSFLGWTVTRLRTHCRASDCSWGVRAPKTVAKSPREPVRLPQVSFVQSPCLAWSQDGNPGLRETPDSSGLLSPELPVSEEML
jgi:hypothetical protein